MPKPREHSNSDPLAGIDVPRIRVEGAVVEALDTLDKVSHRADSLDVDRGRAVAEAIHAARLSLVEALRRCGRDET